MIPHLLVASDSVALPSLWAPTRAFGQLSGLELRNGQMLMPLRVIKRSIDITLASIGILFGADPAHPRAVDQTRQQGAGLLRSHAHRSERTSLFSVEIPNDVHQR